MEGMQVQSLVMELWSYLLQDVAGKKNKKKNKKNLRSKFISELNKVKWVFTSVVKRTFSVNIYVNMKFEVTALSPPTFNIC